MDSPTPPADAVAADSTAAPLTSRRKLVVVLAAGCLVLIGGAIGRQVLLWQADQADFNALPTPRPRLNAPFITSPDEVVNKMVQIAALTKDDLVYDLGCGDGRIIVTAALQTGCQGVGFDIDPERVAEAKENVRLHDVQDFVSIKQQDILQLDLSEANVAIMYLLPWMMQKLAPQFERMKPGSRVVSHDFYIEGVEPERVAQVVVADTRERHFVYLYKTPLRWNPDLPKKPPQQGWADKEDAARAEAAKGDAKRKDDR